MSTGTRTGFARSQQEPCVKEVVSANHRGNITAQCFNRHAGTLKRLDALARDIARLTELRQGKRDGHQHHRRNRSGDHQFDQRESKP